MPHIEDERVAADYSRVEIVFASWLENCLEAKPTFSKQYYPKGFDRRDDKTKKGEGKEKSKTALLFLFLYLSSRAFSIFSTTLDEWRSPSMG